MTTCGVLGDECVDGLGTTASELVDAILAEGNEARRQQDMRLGYYRRLSLVVGGGYFFLVPLTMVVAEQKAAIGSASIFLGIPIISCIFLLHVDATRWIQRTDLRCLKGRYLRLGVHPNCVKLKFFDLICDEYDRVKWEIRTVIMLFVIEVIFVIIAGNGLLGVLIDGIKPTGSE